MIAIGLAGVVLIVLGASRARLGFGAVGDVLVGLTAVTVLSLTYAAGSTLAVRFARRVSAVPAGVMIGLVSGVAVGLAALLGVSFVRPLSVLVLVVVGLWGAVVGDAIVVRRTGRSPKRAGWRLTAAIALSLTAWFGLARDSAAAASADATATTLSSGGAAESFAVKRHRYGSGVNARREEYGSSVAAQTATMDLSAVVPDLSGWRERVHRNYWDIDLSASPRNATVWLPDAPGPHPVAVLIHGVGTDERSEEGWAYVAEPLAAAGIAVVAIDANFLSGPWLHGGDGLTAARIALTLGHLATLGDLTNRTGTPFTGAFDLARVALVGHSRGGEAAAAAAMLAEMQSRPSLPDIAVPPEVTIRAVVALSPTEGLFRPADRDVELHGVPYLLLRGSLDADVPPSAGTGQYDRVTLDANRLAFKASVVLTGANHAQFNTRWGARDHRPPLSWLLAQDGVMPAPLQQRVTSRVLLAFLDEALEPGVGSLERFEAAVAAVAEQARVPIALRTDAASSLALASFDEDVDRATATLESSTVEGHGFEEWREAANPRSENAHLVLSWDRSRRPGVPEYELRPPGDHRLPLATPAAVVLSGASLGGTARLTLEVEDATGAISRSVVTLPENPEFTRRTRRWRSLLLDLSVVPASLPALHTVVIPLSAGRDGRAVDASRLVALRLRFDDTVAGRILLDDIGLRPDGRRTLAQR